MSSLTICSTVCEDSQPSSFRFGLNTRTLTVPGLRLRANSSIDAANAAHSCALWWGNSSSSMRL
ncbi:hypothetical protein NB706_003622 [Xanthomonas sacchari]|nr:hypothetical protein [Xanthomonas sacchari]